MLQSISFWEKNYWEEKQDLIIIGGGIVGLMTAIELKSKSPKHKILIVEKGSIPYGASSRNAGFACFGSVSELLDDFSHISEEKVFETVRLRYLGLKKLMKIVSPAKVKWQMQGGAEIFHTKEDFEKCADQIDSINKKLVDVIGEKETYYSKTHILGNFHNQSICTDLEGQLDPVLMLTTLYLQAKELGVKILTGCNVESWQKINQFQQVHNSLGLTLQADKLLFATNGFTPQLLPKIAMHAVRNQVIITEPIKDLPWKGNFHVDEGYIYFRSVDDERILLGGARNISTKESVDNYGNTSEIIDYLTDFIYNKIKIEEKVKIEHQWSGILGMGETKDPIIRPISSQIFVAVRLGGMGVALGTIVGEKAAEMILNS